MTITASMALMQLSPDDETCGTGRTRLDWDVPTGAPARPASITTGPAAVGPHIPLPPRPLSGALAEALAGRAHDPDTVVRAIRQALEEDLPEAARRILKDAVDRGLSSAAMDACSLLLQPARFVRSIPTPAGDHRADWQWIREHARNHRGQTLAVGGGRLIAAAASFRDLKAELGRHQDAGSLTGPVLVVAVTPDGRVC